MSLPQTDQAGTSGGSWAEIEPLVRVAEEGGADSLWLADHFLYRDEKVEIGLHEAFTLLTAAAAITTRVQVGTLVAATSFRTPGQLAKVAASLQSVAGGRLILGLGCGWHEAEYTAFGYPFDHRVSRFEEIVPVMRALLHGERVTVKGRWIELDDAVILPPPEPPVPILIAAEGPRMLEITARYADAWEPGWYGYPDEGFRALRASLLEAAAHAGRSERIEVFAGVDTTDEQDDDPHLPMESSAIADALAAWEAEGVDHVQVRCYPGNRATFETALEGIRRFKSL